MNAISMTVSVNVTDAKDLVLINQAMTRLMAELNSISALSSQKPVVVVDPETGFAPKAVVSQDEAQAIAEKVNAPKVKRPRTPAQLAHDLILRQQSIARHQALGHTIKAVADPKPAKKSSKKVHEPIAICDICHKGYTSQAELMDHKAEKHPAKDTSKKAVVRKVALNDEEPRPAPKPVKKSVKRTISLDKPVKLSEVVGKGARKVGAAPAAE